MIRINSNNSINLEMLAQDYFTNYFKKNFINIFDNLPQKSRLSKEDKAFLNFLKDKIDTVIMGSPEELESKIIKEVNKLYSNSIQKLKSKKSPITKVVKKIFNYDHFVERGDHEWGAYKFTKELGVSVCPYCNRSFITTYYSKNGKTRPTIDHYLDKASYPYLALSFYNLIPSCYTCNSSLKGTKTFTIDKFLHPHIKGMGDDFRFTVKFLNDYNVDYLTLFDRNINIFELDFTSPTLPKDDEFYIKAERTANKFKLKELYNEAHKDYVVEQIVRARIYNRNYINSLLETFPTLFSGPDDAIRLLTGNYTALEDQDKRVLAKLTRDITNEFKIYDDESLFFKKTM
ncbi:hypothetical protein PH210_23060 [Paenibacillus sp. BSR1-1]|uniref:HNH endonuclease n=1 Tax=Paenibacillus sp. BSR1-1 TaxID=3020845 RepID=UPI0025B15A63|nr:hypothetical protein [Paenibacillus sp. BSR1-1]MDN3019056.1 hypothetical protein [Paenibacillus sp. BSR1-1]